MLWGLNEMTLIKHLVNLKSLYKCLKDSKWFDHSHKAGRNLLKDLSLLYYKMRATKKHKPGRPFFNIIKRILCLKSKLTSKIKLSWYRRVWKQGCSSTPFPHFYLGSYPESWKRLQRFCRGENYCQGASCDLFEVLESQSLNSSPMTPSSALT